LAYLGGRIFVAQTPQQFVDDLMRKLGDHFTASDGIARARLAFDAWLKQVDEIPDGGSGEARRQFLENFIPVVMRAKEVCRGQGAGTIDHPHMQVLDELHDLARDALRSGWPGGASE
jgi:hypothetical protein